MQAHDLKAWRAALRKSLIANRLAITDADRRVWDAAITHHLLSGFPQLTGMSIGLYWPFQGEFDPRPVMRDLVEAGATAALPEVVGKGLPLQFSAWRPGVVMAPGAYDIPVPQGTERVVPQALIIPPVGFDTAGYRLGYGGGFYDRTLAAATPRPVTIGVAYEVSRVESIDPQAFDLPMDYVVTERGIFQSPRSQSAT